MADTVTEKLSDERLRHLVEAADAFGENSDVPLSAGDAASMASELLSCRSATAEPVAVKPLEWRVPTDNPADPDRDENVYCADGIGGKYAISKKQKVGPERLLWMAHDPFIWVGYNSIPEAKAAAQVDYERRIRSALAAPTVSDEMVERGVVSEIAAERRRQVEDEGWTAEHDDAHDQGELARAAMCYAYGAPEYRRLGGGLRAPGSAPSGFVWTIWPWAQQWWKPSDRRRDLVKAGALIVAEIERLDRAALGGHHD